MMFFSRSFSLDTASERAMEESQLSSENFRRKGCPIHIGYHLHPDRWVARGRSDQRWHPAHRRHLPLPCPSRERFHRRKVPAYFFHQRSFGLIGAISDIPQRTADSQQVIVAQVTADLANNHGYRISGKFHFHIDVEVIYGLHQPDTADLKKVIQIFSTHGEALHNAQYQPQISLNEFFSRLLVAGIYFTEVAFQLLLGDDRQLGGIHSADFNSQRHFTVSSCMHKTC